MNFLRVEKFWIQAGFTCVKNWNNLGKFVEIFSASSVEIFHHQRVMNSAAVTLSGSPIWLKTSSALELKSKCELLELATLPLSHFSVLDWTDVIWLHLRMRQINAGDKSPDSRIFRKLAVMADGGDRQTCVVVPSEPPGVQVCWPQRTDPLLSHCLCPRNPGH